jgi:hypothetical protein
MQSWWTLPVLAALLGASCMPEPTVGLSGASSPGTPEARATRTAGIRELIAGLREQCREEGWAPGASPLAGSTGFYCPADLATPTDLEPRDRGDDGLVCKGLTVRLSDEGVQEGRYFCVVNNLAISIMLGDWFPMPTPTPFAGPIHPGR